METAATVILDSMQLLVVQASEAPIEADEAQTCIRAMNRLMARLEVNGIALGYTTVSNLASPITIPDGAIDGLVYNLAVAIAPHFLQPDEPIPALVLQGAKDGLDAMRNIAVVAQPAAFPCTLPVGSGTEEPGFLNSHFYPCPQDQILTEDNQNILLEDGTEEDISGT